MRLSKSHFAQAKAKSVDFAVMEPSKFTAVIPMDAQWTDVGSWPALFQTCLSKEFNPPENKKHSVFTHGKCVYVDTKNCYLSTDGMPPT